MKMLLLHLTLLASTSALAQNLTSIPFYFAIPEEAHLPLADNTWKKVPIKGISSEKAYLRAYSFLDPNTLVGGSVSKTPVATVAAKRKIRQAAVRELFAKGILKHGDVVLSFRPAWENTIPYAHVQMGISHAALIYVENNQPHNLDMPLDSEYNGQNLSSGLDSTHYLETDHLQIVRPREFNGSRATRFSSWISELRKNYQSIRKKGLLKFNPDYSAAKIDRYGEGDSFVTTLGKILRGQDTSSINLTMFCSEFAWAMLSLSNCSPAEIASETGSDAYCVKPAFEAMTMTADGNIPGLTEGPLAVIDSLDVAPADKEMLLSKLFSQGEMSGLSPGHKALATNPQVQQLMSALQMVYPAKLAGNEAAVAQVTAAINAQGGRNYSPTSFLINAMLESNDPERKFDYVGTIIFASKL